MLDPPFLLISRKNKACPQLLLISRLMNRSGLRISYSKVFSSCYFNLIFQAFPCFYSYFLLITLFLTYISSLFHCFYSYFLLISWFLLIFPSYYLVCTHISSLFHCFFFTQIHYVFIIFSN